MTYTVSSGTLNLTQLNIPNIVPEMTYTVSSGTLNLTQLNIPKQQIFRLRLSMIKHFFDD